MEQALASARDVLVHKGCAYVYDTKQQHTVCPQCGETWVARRGGKVRRLMAGEACEWRPLHGFLLVALQWLAVTRGDSRWAGSVEQTLGVESARGFLPRRRGGKTSPRFMHGDQSSAHRSKRREWLSCYLRDWSSEL